MNVKHTQPPPIPSSNPNKVNSSSSWRPIFRKLLGWFIFTLLFSILPFLFNWLSGLIRGNILTQVELTSGGELLLTSVAITAAAVGEMIDYGSKKTYDIRDVLSIGCCILIMVMASFLYSDITAAINSGEKLDESITSLVSLLIFLLAAFTSGLNIAFSEL